MGDTVRGAGIFTAGLIAGLIVVVAARNGAAPGAEHIDGAAPIDPGGPTAALSDPTCAARGAPCPSKDAAPPLPALDAPGAPDRARLAAHLRVAPDLWARLADAARSSERARPLLAAIEAHRGALPSPDAPPSPDAAADYLARSRALLDRAADVGVDAAELSVTIDALRRPGIAGPRGPDATTVAGGRATRAASPSEGPP